jgi:UDP-N-acetylglucosamine--N-acetylmuramyl-(pentapeptide) pyrophosphoryl-undecaprenol N-acetylglucosamine transferase
MRIVLTGSGSGGHFYPLVAVAEAIIDQAREQKLLLPELYLMGPDPYDQGVLVKHGIAFIRIPAGKVRRYFSFLNILDGFKTLWGVLVAIWRLIFIYPDVIMSKGSYTSMPVIIAARLLRIPVVIHESDVHPGRANKFASRFARVIATSYESSAKFFPNKQTVRTGIPIRKHMLTPISGNPLEQIHMTVEGPLILVLGGSQGAERINDLIITALDELLPVATVLHQTGEHHAQVVVEAARALTKKQEYLSRYHVRGFLDVDMMHAALSAASIVVSRAGSGSIYEIALHGKPSILIPIPESISHDQRTNAYEYARTGAAAVMEEKNLTPHLLSGEIARILSDQSIQMRMQEAALKFAPRDAAQQIAATLIAIGLEHA